MSKSRDGKELGGHVLGTLATHASFRGWFESRVLVGLCTAVTWRLVVHVLLVVVRCDLLVDHPHRLKHVIHLARVAHREGTEAHHEAHEM